MAPSMSLLEQDGFESRSEQGLARLLQHQFKLFSDTMAIESGSHALTYSELNTRALNLAREIHRYQIRSEEPIGILALRSINHVLAHLCTARCWPSGPASRELALQCRRLSGPD